MSSSNSVPGVLSDSLVNGKHRRTWPSLDGNSEMDIDSDCDEEVGGRITVCIGDIHGNLAKLEKLWKNLEKHIGPGPFNYCSFIFLGDYCDRGPNTKGALEFLSTLKYRYPYQVNRCYLLFILKVLTLISFTESCFHSRKS